MVEHRLMDGKPYAVLRRPAENALTAPCPFCGKQHQHGITDGHRGAHCTDEAPTEIMVEGVTLYRSDGYILLSDTRCDYCGHAFRDGDSTVTAIKGGVAHTQCLEQQQWYEKNPVAARRAEHERRITVGALREQLEAYPDYYELSFGATMAGHLLSFYRVKNRSGRQDGHDAAPYILSLELSEDESQP